MAGAMRGELDPDGAELSRIEEAEEEHAREVNRQAMQVSLGSEVTLTVSKPLLERRSSAKLNR